MYYFIVNEHGGSGKAIKTWKKVQKILDSNQIPYEKLVTTESVGASALARNVSSLDGEINLVVVGGDGTINEVLNGIGDFERVSLGVIPTGSGNDFARGMKIPRDTKKAVDLILKSGSYKQADIGKVTFDDGKSRLFGISSGMGMDAIVCKKALKSKLKNFLNRLGLGQFIYIIYTVQTLFSMKTETFKISFDGEAFQDVPKLIFIAFMNLEAEGGGVKMFPGADSQNGKLSVCLASGIPKLRAFAYLPFLVAGKQEKLRGFLLRQCSEIEVSCPKGGATLHLDGEYGGEVSHLKVRVLPGKLRLIGSREEK